MGGPLLGYSIGREPVDSPTGDAFACRDKDRNPSS